MTRRLAAPLAALVCAGLLVLTGCSSSGGGDGNPNVDVTTVPLLPGDLPSSWTAKAHDTSDDASGDASGKILATCIGAKDNSGDRVKKVYSKDYSMGKSMITSDASEYKSSADVDAAAKLFSSPKIKPCSDKLLKQESSKGLPAGATIDKTNLTITPGKNGGPANVVGTLSAAITLSAQGQTITIYNTSVAIRGKKIQASIDFTSTGKPIDKSTITKAVAAIAKRAEG